MGPVLRRQRRLLRGPRFPGRGGEDGHDQQGSPDRCGAAPAAALSRARAVGLVQITEGYPWDQVAPYAELARDHPGGMVDLSIGTPVDPTPEIIQEALRRATDAPGYPTVHGTAELRTAISDWFARVSGVSDLDPQAVMPTIGSKELVGLLPSLLSIGPGDVVVVPTTAYPTYEIGARLAGAQLLVADDVQEWAHNPA